MSNNNATALKAITPDQLESAYDGRAGRCACGCSGTHYYMGEVELENAEVARILRTIQRHADVAHYWTYASGRGGWGWQSSRRLFCVYTSVPVEPKP